MSNSNFVNDIINNNDDSYSLEAYLLNDIIKLLDKVILNKLSSDLLFQKNYWSWGFVTIYYSNFYMAQLLNRVAGKFFVFKSGEINQSITLDDNSLYVPLKNGETAHTREFKRLKDNFSYIKTWDDIKINKLLKLVNIKDKNTLFKFTIDNDIKESKIRNKINYQLKEYKETEHINKLNLVYKKIYNTIIGDTLCQLKDQRNFNLVQINQKRFLFLSIFIKEIKQINPAFKLKINRLNDNLISKYDKVFHNVNLDIKNSIQGMLS